MASHGIARTDRTRTEEQRQQDRDRIQRYKELEGHIRVQVQQKRHAEPALFQLTSKILRLNPEYYTIWNVRRRCLIAGLLSRGPDDSRPLKGTQSTSLHGTAVAHSASYSSSSLDPTPGNPVFQQAAPADRSGITADGLSTDGYNDTSEQQIVNQQANTVGEDIDDAPTLRSELSFTIPILLEYPKCYWIWDHRSWVLQQAIDRLPLHVARQIWEAELGLVSKMLTKDRRNFHAWGYRRRVVKVLESPGLAGVSMAETEFAYTTKMIHADLSNFSAWHHRSQLLSRLMDERGADAGAREAFLRQELTLAKEGLNVGPDDQSLWYYHQFLMSQVVDDQGLTAIAPALATADRVQYAKQEIEEIKDLLEDYQDVKWIYEALVQYTRSLCALGGFGSSEHLADMLTWLAKLRQLDPMRRGRWDDMERDLVNTEN